MLRNKKLHEMIIESMVLRHPKHTLDLHKA